MKNQYFWPAAGLSAVVAVLSARQMIQLDAQQLLWGHRPLWLFLSVWALIALFGARLLERRGGVGVWKKMGLASLGGLLLGLGFPGLLPLPWLMFVGWLPLLALAQASQQAARPLRDFWPYAWLGLMLWNILSTYWVANAALAAGLFAIIVNSLLMLLPWLGWLLSSRAMPRLGYVPLVAYWLSFEYLHYNWDLTWPWLTLGNSFAQFPAWIQWYEYTGVFGGSWWIWLINLLLYRGWQLSGGLAASRHWALALLLIALPAAFSFYRYYSYQEEGNSIEVVAVQPNFEPHYQKFTLPEHVQADRYLELSLSQLDSTVDYLVYPETSFGYVEERQISNYPALQYLREGLAAYPTLQLVTGLNAYRDFAPGEPLTDAARARRGSGGQQIYYETLNSAAQLGMAGQEVQTYRKSKLVPGPESFPFKRILFFMEPLVEQLEGTTAGLGTQPQRSVFQGKARIAPVICYESVFGEYYGGYVRPRTYGQPGAQAAFILTNDGWWDDTPGHRQHLYFASLRAIEGRRPLVRSANTGISAFINQRGDITASLPYNTAGALRGSMILNDRLTFYHRWGDMIARIAFFLTLLLAFSTLSRSLSAAKGPNTPAA